MNALVAHEPFAAFFEVISLMCTFQVVRGAEQVANERQKESLPKMVYSIRRSDDGCNSPLPLIHKLSASDVD